MKRKKYKTLSAPINYWFLMTLLLSCLLITFSILLIKERQFLTNMQIYLDKFKLKINDLYNLNAKISNSHLSMPTDPSSSSQIIYLTLENYTYKK
jgi:hypothetical protein